MRHLRTVALGVAVFLMTSAGFSGVRADPIRDAQWHLDYLNIAQAHTISQGEGITVAVVDSGVDANHPDLAGRVIPGIDLASSPELGLSDPRGYIDYDGHGTGMAGLIAADGRTLGIAPKAKIQPVRVASGGARGGTPDGLVWAATHGAQVINLSRSGVASSASRKAIDVTIANDVVVVAAAGNADDPKAIYPAAYPGVLAVAAIDRTGQYAPVSVSGAHIVIAAPGVDMTSPGLNGGYNQGTQGTSDATAIVSGAVALIRSKYPDLTAPDVIRLITATADDKGEPGRDVLYGYGVINIVKALTTDPATINTAAQQPPPPSENGPPIRLLIGGGIVIVALLAAAGATISWRRSSRS